FRRYTQVLKGYNQRIGDDTLHSTEGIVLLSTGIYIIDTLNPFRIPNGEENDGRLLQISPLQFEWPKSFCTYNPPDTSSMPGDKNFGFMVWELLMANRVSSTRGGKHRGVNFNICSESQLEVGNDTLN
ncbi:15425_t:CDS:2, partial [Acaulospora colombiana]